MKWFVFIILGLSCSPFALPRALGLELGLTTVDLGKLNNMMEDFEDFYEDMGYDVNKEEFGSGFYLGADYQYPVRPAVAFVPRIEYLRPFSGELNADRSGQEVTMTQSLWLFCLMGGGRWFLPLASPVWTVSAEAFLGLALGGTTIEADYEGVTFWEDYKVHARGSGVIFELGVRAKRSLSSGYDWFLSAGYRSCDLDEMEATEDVDEANIDEGDEIEDPYGRDIHFDFGGLKFGVGVEKAF